VKSFISRPRFETLQNSLLINLYWKSLKAENKQKLAFLVMHLSHAYLNSTARHSLPIMKDERLSKMMVFDTGRNNMILKQLNRVISRFIPAGIVKHELDYGQWYMLRPFDEELVDPRKILALSDLEFGFVLWLASCSVALLVFFGELLWSRIVKVMENLLKLLEFLRFLKVRMTEYHDVW
jgi:hypothetical protein